MPRHRQKTQVDSEDQFSESAFLNQERQLTAESEANDVITSPLQAC